VLVKNYPERQNRPLAVRPQPVHVALMTGIHA
jgi:hypothetical protein